MKGSIYELHRDGCKPCEMSNLSLWTDTLQHERKSEIVKEHGI